MLDLSDRKTLQNRKGEWRPMILGRARQIPMNSSNRRLVMAICEFS